MSICTACGDTRISPDCVIVNPGTAAWYAMWPACPVCATIPRLDHMARVYAYRQRLDPRDADRWLVGIFRADEQAEIRRQTGTAVQLSLFA